MFFFRQLSDDQRLNLAHIGFCLKGVAHNINTPLSAVMGRAEMLQMRLERLSAAMNDETAADELCKCQRDVRIVLENSHRISQIVRNCMRKSINAEQGGRKAINVAELLQDEIEYLLADMQFKHDVVQQVSIDANMPVIYGEFIHFSNTIIELMDNAMRAMQDAQEKRLTVSCCRQGDVIELCVCDSGCGIAAPLQQEVLRTLATGTPGDGLPVAGGLLRVARLLQGYQPHYRLISTPGETAVTICIPIAHNSVA